MRKRILAASLVVVALGAMPFARAHDDAARNERRCDTWHRPGHLPDPESEDSHHHSDPSDTSPGDPVGTTVHSDGGHVVVRNQLGYLEAVGGNEYEGPHPNGARFPGEGGFVQGGIDPGEGQPDVDWSIVAFTPDASALPEPDAAALEAWLDQSYGRACVNAGGNFNEIESRQP